MTRAVALYLLATQAALFVLSLGMVTATFDVGRAQVVDAFQAWQQLKCAGNASCLANTYKIERRGKKHIVSGGDFSTVVRTIVDSANGYLMIDDEGTGGGNAVTEAAVFTPASGPALFVVAARVYDALNAQNGSIDVYRWSEGILTAAAPTLFSVPEPRDFVPSADRANATGFSRSTDGWNETVFHLPRKGGTIAAYLLRFDVGQCVRDDWMGQPESVRLAVCGAAARAYRPMVAMTFDKSTGRFRRGALSFRKPPPLR